MRQGTPLAIEQTIQDTRFAVRLLLARPGFSLAAAATLALGIGTTTLIFSVVEGVVLTPLPFRAPEELVRLWSANPRGIPRNAVSPPDFLDLRDQAVGPQAFSGLSAFLSESATLAGAEPERILVGRASDEFFDVLGADMLVGAGFHASKEGVSGTAVISERFWATRFNRDPSAVGRTVVLDDTPLTVVGVLPDVASYPSSDIDLWTPMPRSYYEFSRNAHFLDIVGRLAPGVRFEEANGVIDTVARRLETTFPASNRGWRFTVLPLHESVVGDVRKPLFVLLAAVACVLLIACANVASLVLARGAGRGQEFAVRAALGAGRLRVARQQLVECSVLAGVGGVAGFALAWSGVAILQNAVGMDLPRLQHVALDGTVFAVAVTLSALTALATALAPAWRASQAEPSSALREGRSAGPAPSTRRVRSLLVAAEIALTLALLVGAGLLMRSFFRLASVNPGFQADHVLLARVSLPPSRYEPGRWPAFFDAALADLRALPGVRDAGAGAPLPLSGQPGLMRFGVRFERRPEPTPGQADDRVYLRWATVGYFEAMGIPVLEGRTFRDADRADAPPVVVVDRAFVDKYFGRQSPIGQRIRTTNDRTFRQIVGVVGSVRQTSLQRASDPHVYVVHTQRPSPDMTFVLRTVSDPTTIVSAVRERVRRLDPSLPVFDVSTLEAVVSGTVADRRFYLLLLAAFASLAVVLTLVGVYGIVACWVAESAKETGIRLALGASPRDVMRMLMLRTLRVTGTGVAAGAAVSMLVGRLMASLLFEVRPADLGTLAAAATLILSASLAAAYLPARRALAFDPSDMLRLE